jgi:hypothetical protein
VAVIAVGNCGLYAGPWGVRVEDAVVIGEKGPQVLTAPETRSLDAKSRMTNIAGQEVMVNVELDLNNEVKTNIEVLKYAVDSCPVEGISKEVDITINDVEDLIQKLEKAQKPSIP